MFEPRNVLEACAERAGRTPRYRLPQGIGLVVGVLSETFRRLLGIRPMITRHAVALMGGDNGVDTTRAPE